MGTIIAQRQKFYSDVTDAFSPSQIEATHAKLQPLDPAADHLDIFHKLGLLSFLRPEQHDAYRRSLGIPALNQSVITQVLHFCLAHKPKPLPLVFTVAQGPSEEVVVSAMHDGVHLLVRRAGFDRM